VEEEEEEDAPEVLEAPSGGGTNTKRMKKRIKGALRARVPRLLNRQAMQARPDVMAIQLGWRRGGINSASY